MVGFQDSETSQGVLWMIYRGKSYRLYWCGINDPVVLDILDQAALWFQRKAFEPLFMKVPAGYDDEKIALRLGEYIFI